MKVLLSIVFLSLLFGCDSEFGGGTDPYPAVGGKRLNPYEPTADVRKPFTMIVPKTIKLIEGRETSIKILATVPAPGQPDIKIENLPAGASFDKKKMIFTWRPSFFDGNDLNDPTIKVQTYEIRILLYSRNILGETDITSQDAIDKTVVLKVHDLPMHFDIDGGKRASVLEGSVLKYKFKIENQDYPKGPFQVSTEGFPANTFVKKVTENEFQITYAPGYQHVKINESTGCGNTW
ncbi:MAG: hypothetical protein HON90_05315, partial [Halobacteriovoraceae bacterium]|nr:hypothetical protein [Halobacteriovoraceae bacterium]